MFLGGKKCNTKLYLQNDSMVLNLDKNLRELNIDCTSVHLCHQLKEFILQKIHNTNDKQLSEDLVLDIQVLLLKFYTFWIAWTVKKKKVLHLREQ